MAFTPISSARIPVDYLTFEELGQSARVYQGSGSLANFSRGSSWRTPNHKWHGHSAAVLTVMWAEVRNISGALGRSSRYRGVVDVPPQCDTYFRLLNAPWAWDAKKKARCAHRCNWAPSRLGGASAVGSCLGFWAAYTVGEDLEQDVFFSHSSTMQSLGKHPNLMLNLIAEVSCTAICIEGQFCLC